MVQQSLYPPAMVGRNQDPKLSLKAAADHLGGQTALARALSEALDREVSQQWVWNVLNRRQQPIPAEWCLPIEKFTAGKVPAHILRPDLYRAPSKGRAA